MKKEDVIWHEEDEYPIMSDKDGWTLVCVMNHFKGKFWYEIKTPDNYYIGFYRDIYEAIDSLNEEKLKI